MQSDGESRSMVLRKIKGDFLSEIVWKNAPENSSRMREEVMTRISLPRTTQSVINEKSVLPTVESLLSLKAQILHRVMLWEPVSLRSYAGKWVAVVTVCVIVLRLTPTLFLAPPLLADSQHLLIPTSGFVSITVDGEWKVIENDTDLLFPLSIRTGSDSSATIITNDAVLRLGENTELNLREGALDSSPGGPIARVIYGQIWLMSLLPEPLSAETALVLPQGTLSIKEGSVSLLADPRQSSIQVFHRFANIRPTNDESIHLTQGDQITLLPDGSLQRHIITDAMRSDEWVRTNSAKDAVHRSEIAEKHQEMAQTVAGILPTSAFYSIKRVSETVDLWLTFGSKSRKEKRLQHAETRLNEAVVLLKQGKTDAAAAQLSDYRAAIREFATLTEGDVHELLTSSLISSSATLATALPLSDIYPAKKAVIEAASEAKTASVSPEQIDLYLVVDALLTTESLISEGKIKQASQAMQGLEPALASILDNERLGELAIDKDSLKAVKTVLRSMLSSLSHAEESVQSDQAHLLSDLKSRIEQKFPPEEHIVASAQPAKAACMTNIEITRRANQILSTVFSLQTSRAQRNAVIELVSKLPDCTESGRVLSLVMNKLPVFTRSFVWDAMQKLSPET